MRKIHDKTSIPVIWQGCAQVDIQNKKQQISVWNKAIELGSTAFDTAELYDNGESESILGEVIKNNNRHELYISTKVAPENSSINKILNSCNNSLERLQTDYIDLYHLHWTNPDVSLEEISDSMKLLLEKDKIRHVGVCNFTLQQIQEFIEYLGEVPLMAVQMEYNMINRKCEYDIIPFCQKNSILFQEYTPLKLGKTPSSLLNELSKKYDKTINQIILNWLTRNDYICALPKTSNIKHLEENCTSTDFDIEDIDIELIDKEFPYELHKIKCSEIIPLYTGIGGSNNIYMNIEDALENKFNYMPSPENLSKELKHTKQLSKPVYIKIENDKKFLVGGNVRYWAWVLAFGYDTEIDCIVN